MKFAFAIFLSLFIVSCTMSEPEVSFYHWKANAKYSNTIKSALEEANTKRIYLHYFDVDKIKKATDESDGVYPVAVLKSVDELYKEYEIVPTIFITNRALKQTEDIIVLANRIHTLIEQISKKHFKQTHQNIQLDCDWTRSTASAYFQLIEHLQQEYNYSINCTIRLHQIKYAEETGIPPIEKGTLMLYNVGKLFDMNQNSILESSTVKNYINSESTYPLELDIALPLFSQLVIKNKNNKVRLINQPKVSDITEDQFHFKPIGKNVFDVINDTLYRGMFLSKGLQLKLETLEEKVITESYSVVKQSKLKVNDVVFYHLDDRVLSSVELNQILLSL